LLTLSFLLLISIGIETELEIFSLFSFFLGFFINFRLREESHSSFSKSIGFIIFKLSQIFLKGKLGRKYKFLSSSFPLGISFFDLL
jgi:hypothetical protein